MDLGRPGTGSQERVTRQYPTEVIARPCRACGKLIYDLKHERTGRVAPIEAVPVPDGNIVVDLAEGRYRLVLMPDIRMRGPRYRNHFATCPEAQKFHRG